jgi:uncharacterized RDD family membrane protein YckC
MISENPYQSPATDPILPTPVPDSEFRLATRGDRFLGSFVDGMIGIGIALPVWGILYFLGVIHSVEEMGRIGISYGIGIGLVHYAVFMAIQWNFLKSTGQTIGKRMAKTRIAKMDGSKPDIRDLALKRYGFVSLISMIPVAGAILAWVDILLIFKKDRRCLHDLVAGTQVLSVDPVA